MKGKTAIPVLTAYTTPVARSLERAQVAAILVGDTVGVVEMGFASTRAVTLDHMAYHVGAVRSGAPATHVIGDLPYLADVDPQTALTSAQRLLDAGADSVKLEGPKYAVISALVAAGVAVVGHIGLTPQTSENFRQVGQNAPDARRILDEALGVTSAGAFMLVLEHMPDGLAARITHAVAIPTIGIGAGKACDGQVLVINDAIGLGERWPPFSRQYVQVGASILVAAETFVAEVREGRY